MPTRVGSRDGVGDPGCLGLNGRVGTAAAAADGRAVSFVAVTVPRAEVSFAKRGILFGSWPFAFARFAITSPFVNVNVPWEGSVAS